MKLTIAALGLFALAVAAAGAEDNSQEELAVAEARHHGYGGGHGGHGGHRGGYGKGQNRGYSGHGHNRGKRDTAEMSDAAETSAEDVQDLSDAESRHMGHGAWGHKSVGYGHGGYAGHGGGHIIRAGHGHYRGKRDASEAVGNVNAEEDLAGADSRHHGYRGAGHGQGHGLARGGYGHHGGARGGYGQGHGAGHHRGKRDAEAVEVVAEDLVEAESRHHGYGGHGHARGGYGHAGGNRGAGYGQGHGHGGHYRGKRDVEAVDEEMSADESKHGYSHGKGLSHHGYGHHGGGHRGEGYGHGGGWSRGGYGRRHH